MNLRPKTMRRLMVLLAGALLCASFLGAVIEIQLYRHEAVRQRFRDKAMLEYSKGDYVGAIIGFKKYLSQSSGDAPAIYAYAVSRSQVPEPDLKHLIEAKTIFSRYLEINPSDSRAQHRLLDIYRQIRYDAEARTLAETLLAQDPNDVEALNAKLQALIDQRDYETALPISMRINELTPLDLDAQMTTYRLMAQLKTPPDEMVNRAQRMLEDHPGDPRFELLRAVAAGFDADDNGVGKWLRIASGRPSPDAQFVRALSALYERIGWFDQSRKLLADWLDAPHADPQMLANLVERQWEAGDYQAALDRLAQIDSSDLNEDAQLLGLKALTLYTRNVDGDRKMADIVRYGLSRRNGENVASAWNSLLSARFSLPPIPPNQAVKLCQSALHRDPDNPIGRFFLGLSYNDLGETELALQCWRLSANLAPSWAAPHLSKAQALLDAFRLEQANAEAQAARACSGNTLDSQIMLALVSNAQLGTAPSSQELDSLLADFQAIHSQHPAETRILSDYVELLARSGRRNQALQIAQSALRSPAPQSSLPPSVLLSLARVSAKEHLGLEPAIADLLEQIKPNSPETIYDRALVLAMLGERADGLRSLTAARDAADKDSVQWQLVVMQFHQVTGDEQASADWALLGDANPKNLFVQRAVLQASAPGPNRGLVDRTIERIKALTGEECISWRLARARWELAGTTNIKTNAGAAAAMMGDVVRMAPDLPEPQLLWATALEKLGDLSGAVDRLRAADTMEPGDFDISLRLADLLQLHGDDDQATDTLENLAKSQFNFPDRQLQIARLLWQQGQPQAAVRVLELHGARFAPLDRDLLLAQIDQNQGDSEQAGRLYDELISSPSPSDAILKAVAWFDATRGDVIAGRHVLERLTDAPELTQAQYDEAFGSVDAAMAHYQAVVSAAPSDPAAWRALAGFELRAGNFADAAATADAALKLIPTDAQLLALKSHASTIKTLPTSPALKLLIDALSASPNDEASVQTLNALLAGQGEPSPAGDPPPTRLREVADNYPRFLPAQMLLAEAYFSSGRIDEAQAAAEQAMRAAPTAAEPARMLADITGSVHLWNNALHAAQQWRNRTLSRPSAADAQIALAKLNLNDPAAAIAQLSPYLAQAQTSPNQNIELIKLYAQALVQAGRTNDATALLIPMLPQSPRWRTLWLDLAVQTCRDAATAKSWIDKVAPLESTGTDDDRLALATACTDLGKRFNDSSLLTQGRDIVQPLTDRKIQTAAPWLILGSIAQHMNDLPAAEADFRKAIQIDALNADAKNDLANVILLQTGDLDEARRFAQDAIAQSPTNSTFRCTLASIDARSDDLNSAIAGFNQAIALNAQSADALIGLADVQLRSAHRQDAALSLTQAETLLDARTPLPEPQRKRLEDLRKALRKNTQTTSISDVK